MNDYFQHETTKRNVDSVGGTIAFLIWIAIAMVCPLLAFLIMLIVGES